MAILKKRTKKRDFTIICNTLLQDEQLSYEAKGVLMELLSRPEDWVIRKSQLIRTHTRVTKLNRMFNELKRAGYLYVYYVRGMRDGRNVIIDRCWIVSEYPMTIDYFEKAVDSLKVGKPYVKESLIKEERQLQNKNSLQSTESLQNTETNGYAETIITHLNNKFNSKYKTTSKKTRSLISARLKEGFSVEDFKTVIDKKYNEWFEDNKMAGFLRPETLFSNKFESYLNQKEVKKQWTPTYD